MLDRDKLNPATDLVLLEDIIEKHQGQLVKSTVSHEELKILLFFCSLYTEGLVRENRPIAATQLLRNLAAVLRNRAKSGERFAGCRLSIILETLYRALSRLGGDPRERWKVICEANDLSSKLTPDDWDPEAPRSLRVQRAQILQFFNAEENRLYEDPSTRRLALDRLIANQDKVLRLEHGHQGQRSDKTRIKALRAICSLKEEKGGMEDYRVYAKEYNRVMQNKHTAAGDNLDTATRHEYLTSFVVLTQALIRAKMFSDALTVSTEGLAAADDCGWPEGYGPQVERCQLLVHRSRCHLKIKEPQAALTDAYMAVAEADAILWDGSHPDPDVEIDYPSAYNKSRWRCFALLNFIDIVYDGQVDASEEQYGLLAADKGLSLIENMTSYPDKTYYEAEFRAKKVRALRKLRRWDDALAECSSLSRRLTLLMPSSNRVQDVTQQLVEVYEDAASCFEAKNRKDLSNKLFDHVDAFADFIEKDMPLDAYIVRAEDLQARFVNMYKELMPSQVEGLSSMFGRLCECFRWGKSVCLTATAAGWFASNKNPGSNITKVK